MKPSHNRMMRTVALCAIVCALMSSGAIAQTELENAIKQYGAETVAGYVQPVADLFGADMHAGYYHNAWIAQSGFSLGFDIVVMGSIVEDAQKFYVANTPPGFDPTTFKTSTIFGPKVGATVNHSTIAGLVYKGLGGVFNTSILPLAVPQLRIGSLYGSDLTVRFVTVPEIGEAKFPIITLWGVGLRHSISQYIPSSPVDIATGVYFNSFKVGDVMDFKGFAVNLQASKSIKILILYGGFAYESSKMNLTYTSTDPSVPAAVDIDLDGANNFRFTAGVGLSLGIIKVFADANFGSITNYSAGIGFGR
jgi:hypothetical protein